MLQYVEKLDLSGFVSLKDDCSRDRNLEAARLILRMKDGEIKLTVSVGKVYTVLLITSYPVKNMSNNFNHFINVTHI